MYSYKIRELAVMDTALIRQICLIEKECFSSSWSYEQFIKALESGKYLILALLNDNTVTSYLVLQCIPSVKNLENGEMEIINIATKNSHRRMGYAELLLSYAIEFAKEKQICSFFLDVRETNISAKKLYEKLHFKIVGRRKNYYTCEKGKEDALVMAFEFRNTS